MKDKLIGHLEQFVTERRLQLINKVLDQRTRYITVVLEDIYQPQNASAVLRTCECLGIQDIHIIENRNKYQINPDVVLGANKWLNLYAYNKDQMNTSIALTELKASGYRIIAATPHKKECPLPEFDIAKGKMAVLFGTELEGLTKEAIELADEFITIPMFGFTESFNISVSAAIVLHQLTNRLRNSKIDWTLTENEKKILKLQWLKNSIKKSNTIEKGFLDGLKANENIPS